MIIVSMVALQATSPLEVPRPFAAALCQGVDNLGLMFRKIDFAQMHISLINTAVSALYLLVVLPLIGVHLPLTKTMMAATFLAGLISVVSNIVQTR